MAGKIYPQHSEGDTVEPSVFAVSACFTFMLGHPNFKITRPIAWNWIHVRNGNTSGIRNESKELKSVLKPYSALDFGFVLYDQVWPGQPFAPSRLRFVPMVDHF